jgi:hypothetical protein
MASVRHIIDGKGIEQKKRTISVSGYIAEKGCIKFAARRINLSSSGLSPIYIDFA